MTTSASQGRRQERSPPSAAPPSSTTKASRHQYTASSLPSLAVGDVGDGAILLHMHVQTILHKVLGNHLAGLDDPVLLREFLLGEELKEYGTISPR